MHKKLAVATYLSEETETAGWSEISKSRSKYLEVASVLNKYFCTIFFYTIWELTKTEKRKRKTRRMENENDKGPVSRKFSLTFLICSVYKYKVIQKSCN